MTEPNGLTPVARTAYDRAIALIEAAWDEQCCGNRNEDACESCRAYGDAVRSVEWGRDHPDGAA